MNAKNLIIVLTLSVIFSACQKNAPKKELPTVKPTMTASANTAPNISGNSTIKTYDGTGIVTKINLEIVSVELKHEEIKDLMPAMQMEFYVSDKKMLENLKIGDKVDFVLEDNAGAEKIINIKKK